MRAERSPLQLPRDTTRRGELSEFEIIAALLRAGRVVVRPLSAGLRYDLVIDSEDGTFARREGRADQALLNRRIDAVKPCRKFLPATGPISPAAKKPATGTSPNARRTAFTS